MAILSHSDVFPDEEIDFDLLSSSNVPLVLEILTKAVTEGERTRTKAYAVYIKGQRGCFNARPIDTTFWQGNDDLLVQVSVRLSHRELDDLDLRDALQDLESRVQDENDSGLAARKRAVLEEIEKEEATAKAALLRADARRTELESL